MAETRKECHKTEQQIRRALVRRAIKTHRACIAARKRNRKAMSALWAADEHGILLDQYQAKLKALRERGFDI